MAIQRFGRKLLYRRKVNPATLVHAAWRSDLDDHGTRAVLKAEGIARGAGLDLPFGNPGLGRSRIARIISGKTIASDNFLGGTSVFLPVQFVADAMRLCLWVATSPHPVQ
jgi:hypothetical protein